MSYKVEQQGEEHLAVLPESDGTVVPYMQAAAEADHAVLPEGDGAAADSLSGARR